MGGRIESPGLAWLGISFFSGIFDFPDKTWPTSGLLPKRNIFDGNRECGYCHPFSENTHFPPHPLELPRSASCAHLHLKNPMFLNPESSTKYPKFLPKSSMLMAAWFALFALVHHPVSAQTIYTWTNTAGNALNWGTGTNWSGGVAPNPVAGDTVDFSTVNIAANTTLTFGADRTAQLWKFGDTSGSQTWTVSAGNSITLAGTTPTINVVNGTTTLNNVLTGSSGFTKAGAGTLAFAGINTFSGNVTISAGTLTGLDSTTLAQAGSLVFTGTGSATTSYGNQILSQGVIVNSGVTATFNFPSNAYAFRFNGPVSGSGTIAVTGASATGVYLGLYNTANTFSGTLVNPTGVSTTGGFRVGSLADSANPIRLGAGAFELVDGGVSITLNNHIDTVVPHRPLATYLVALVYEDA